MFFLIIIEKSKNDALKVDMLSFLSSSSEVFISL